MLRPFSFYTVPPQAEDPASGIFVFKKLTVQDGAFS